MKKLLLGIALAGVMLHAQAQTNPPAPSSERYLTPRGGLVANGAPAASDEAQGNLTPLYVGAGVVAGAILIAVLDGGGSHSCEGCKGGATPAAPNPPSGSPTGTTGTH